jgi:predicted  nucleic acid-binding Zn ribbon protein
MYTAEIIINWKSSAVGKNDDCDFLWDAENQIDSWLASFIRRGQIVGHEQQIRTAKGYRIFAQVPTTDALERKHSSQWVEREINELALHGLQSPKIKIIGASPAAPEYCDYEKRSSLILFTTFVALGTPLHCGDCWKSIPPYLLPELDSATADRHFEIRSWAGNYQACDSLWMNSSIGERFGKKQISRFDSKLSREGRELCSQLEELCGIPVYYYLHRSGGRNLRKEKKRKCPGCGGKWALEAPLHGLFDFKCDCCHLLSQISFEFR